MIKHRSIYSYAFVVSLSFFWSCTPEGAQKESINASEPTVDFRYQPREWQTCYGLKDDTFKSMIDRKGGLWYNFVAYSSHIGFPYPNYTYERNKGYSLAIIPYAVNAGEKIAETQQLKSSKIPIVINRVTYDSLKVRQTTLASFTDPAVPLDTRYDVCALEITGSTQPCSLRVEFNSIYPMEMDEDGTSAYLTKYDGDKELIAKFPQPVNRFAGHISKMKYSYYLDFMVESKNNQGDFYFVIPRSGQEHLPSMPLSLSSEEQKIQAYWENLSLPYHYLVIPDSGIQHLLHSSIRNIYQAREIIDGIPAFQVGPTFYRGTWAVDGPFFMEAMTYLG